MNHKNLFAVASVISAMAFLAVFPANGADYIHIRTTAGWEVLELDNLKSLDFNAGTVTATDIDGKPAATFAQNALEMIYVDDSTENNDNVGVPVSKADSDEVNFTFDSSAKTVLMHNDGEFELYSAGGTLMVKIPDVKKGETIGLAGIASGVVILKSGNQTLKALLK